MYVYKSSSKNILEFSSRLIHTVDENIIATIKMRNNFCYLLKMKNFPILQYQYWTFLYCSPISYRSSYFASVVNLFMASFLYCFPYSYRSFTLLKALAQSNGNLIARKSDNFRKEAIKKEAKN